MSMAGVACEWQHCLNLDARFSALRFPNDPAFRTLYLRRRRQLLANAVRNRDYLRLRSSMLSAQFGTGAGSIRGSITSQQQEPGSGLSLFRTSSAGRFYPRGPPSMCSLSDSPSKSSVHSPPANSRPPPPPSSYTFAGVFHIFDDHTKSVTRILFLNDKSRLATASADGRVVIRQVVPPPASTVAVLMHSTGVLDMDCSETNELLVTAAADATVRLWSLTTAKCMRSITLSSPHMPTVTRFLPINNNFILVGTSKQTVQLINISTGRSVKRACGKIAGAALSVCFCPAGGSRTFWVGDDTGSIYSFTCDIAVSSLVRTNRVTVADGLPINSLACRILPAVKKPSTASKAKQMLPSTEDSLLLVAAGTSLWLFTISQQYSTSSTLSPVQTSNPPPRPVCQIPIRLSGSAIFAPLLTSSRWLVLAAGSSDVDNVVSIVAVDSASAVPDTVFTAGAPSILTALPGHASAITCLDFAYDETLLASADCSGTVIVWKR